MTDLLIVEDTLNVAQAFALMLRRAGFVCQTAASERGALAAAEKQWPDVVLLDLSVQGLGDGWQIWDALAQMAAGRPVGVIVIYSEFKQDDKAETIKRGGVYVSKMAGIEKIVGTIRGILSA